MTTRLVASTIAVSAVTIVLAGCGTGAGTPSEPVQSSPTQAASPIPQVKNPRDVTAMVRRTCELLTPAQAKSFGLDIPPEQREGLFGTLNCEWMHTTRERETIRTVDISLFANNPTLEVSYSKNRDRPFFELAEIASYPAIVSRTNADLAICDVDIKTAERQSVSITYHMKDRSSPQQSCVVAKQVAAAVVANVPPKN